MHTYGQFCPVAKAMEVIGTRWTTLVLREVVGGARRFSDIHRGVPLMSRGLLVQRLEELEAAGLIDRFEKANGHGHEYAPTDACAALRPVLEALTVWGQTHMRDDIGPDDCDPGLFIWKLHGHTDPARFPDERFTLQLSLRNLPRGRRAVLNWWLVANPGALLDVCPKQPGFPVDVVIEADIASLVKVWLGYRGLSEAESSGDVAIIGTRQARARVIRMLDLRNAPYMREFSAVPIGGE
jgi:DNA-binding HxlR family transcriptional regulator